MVRIGSNTAANVKWVQTHTLPLLCSYSKSQKELESTITIFEIIYLIENILLEHVEV